MAQLQLKWHSFRRDVLGALKSTKSEQVQMSCIIRVNSESRNRPLYGWQVSFYHLTRERREVEHLPTSKRWRSLWDTSRTPGFKMVFLRLLVSAEDNREEDIDLSLEQPSTSSSSSPSKMLGGLSLGSTPRRVHGKRPPLPPKAATPPEKRAKATEIEDLQLEVLREQLKFYKLRNEQLEEERSSTNEDKKCVKDLLARIEALEADCCC